jgi:hypothetical protein
MYPSLTRWQEDKKRNHGIPNVGRSASTALATATSFQAFGTNFETSECEEVELRFSKPGWLFRLKGPFRLEIQERI